MSTEANGVNYDDASIDAIRETAFKEGYSKGFDAGRNKGYDEGYEEGYAQCQEDERKKSFLTYYDEEATMEAFRREGFVESYTKKYVDALMDVYEKEHGRTYLEDHCEADVEEMRETIAKEADRIYSVDRAKALLKAGQNTYERISKLSHLTVEQIEELAEQMKANSDNV